MNYQNEKVEMMTDIPIMFNNDVSVVLMDHMYLFP